MPEAKNKPSSLASDVGLARAPVHSRALTLDYDLYDNFLEDADLSETEKREFIEALWSIVVAFVDLGFEIHPAQLATKTDCEQIAKNGHSITKDLASMVNCSQSTQAEFLTKSKPTSATEGRPE